jgi:hypothetical protein
LRENLGLQLIVELIGDEKENLAQNRNMVQRGRGVKVQNWPHIILKNNARHRIKTIY